MRTTGTFKEIHAQAARYADGTDSLDISDPVVRREDGVWMIESRLCASDGDVEVTWENFADYWFPGFNADVDEPTESDITTWLEYVEENFIQY